MSYILEALRKADQERSAGSVPDLEAVHESSGQEAGSGRWIWILGVFLLANALLLAVLLLRDGQNEPAPVVEAGSPAPQTKAVSESPAPPPAVVVSRPAPRAPPPAVTVKRPAPSPVSPPAVPVASGRVASATPVAPPPAPELSRRVAPQPVSPPPAAPQVSRSAPPQPVASADTDSGIPYWDDMSLEFRSGLSMPRLDVHVYDSNPQRRFLLLELKKYREGDTLTNGAVVEEILPDGVQLFYRGTRFVYRK
jgi:general secretion pathway protein B